MKRRNGGDGGRKQEGRHANHAQRITSTAAQGLPQSRLTTLVHKATSYRIVTGYSTVQPVYSKASYT